LVYAFRRFYYLMDAFAGSLPVASSTTFSSSVPLIELFQEQEHIPSDLLGIEGSDPV
jgi:hypothetical protein